MERKHLAQWAGVQGGEYIRAVRGEDPKTLKDFSGKTQLLAMAARGSLASATVASPLGQHHHLLLQ